MKYDGGAACWECGDSFESYGIYAERPDGYLIFCTNPKHKIHLSNCRRDELAALLAERSKG